MSEPAGSPATCLGKQVLSPSPGTWSRTSCKDVAAPAPAVWIKGAGRQLERRGEERGGGDIFFKSQVRCPVSMSLGKGVSSPSSPLQAVFPSSQRKVRWRAAERPVAGAASRIPKFPCRLRGGARCNERLAPREEEPIRRALQTPEPAVPRALQDIAGAERTYRQDP